MTRRLTILAALALCLLCVPATASAQFDLENLEVTFEDKDGNPVSEAGSHPFQMATNLNVTTTTSPEGEVPAGELRNLTVEQMRGFIGNQTAVPKCTAAEFNTRSEGYPACPDESAVGYVAAEAEFEVIK
ncbi:MAG TPA: hypothetical protein VLI94_03755, partial [Solirubrobacterales bacterium]|nr:hypothetical protein [Solirubrobacterales bacterium]